ncbi:glycosyltransferase [Nostocoides sp. F2B08]|nr:glycosyltransferase [Tetrasphaera sp. F2B08]
MRVAYLCADPGVPAFGTKGASVHVQEIIRAWRARGAQVHLYCTRLGDDVPADLRDLPVTHIPVERGTEPAARERAQAAAAVRLARAVLADGADVVYERYSLFSTALAVIGEHTPVAPQRILEVNAPLIEEQSRHRTLVAEAGAWAALRAQTAAADRVVAVSPPVAEWVARHGDMGAGGDVLRVVANGVNVDRIRPSAGARSGLPVVVFVGTLKPWHGIETLVEAAAAAREPWRLRLIGDGPQAEALREQAARLGVEVDFRGAVAPERMGAELADASVAVAPYPQSEDHYFSPLKIYEYAAAGLPVVASAIGQVPQIVADGVTGTLVAPSNVAALAAAIDDLAADPERAARMGAAGRERAVAEHSWTRVLDRVLEGLATDRPDRTARGERRIPELVEAGGRRG